MNPLDCWFDKVFHLVSDVAPPESPCGRDVLESYLVPIVRRAARTGLGLPALVLRVRERLEAGATVGVMTREFGEEILDRRRSRAAPDCARETVRVA